MTTTILIALDEAVATAEMAQRMDSALAETAWVIDRESDVVREYRDADDDADHVVAVHFAVTVSIPAGISTGPGTYERNRDGTWSPLMAGGLRYEGLSEITERVVQYTTVRAAQ